MTEWLMPRVTSMSKDGHQLQSKNVGTLVCCMLRLLPAWAIFCNKYAWEAQRLQWLKLLAASGEEDGSFRFMSKPVYLDSFGRMRTSAQSFASWRLDKLQDAPRCTAITCSRCFFGPLLCALFTGFVTALSQDSAG